MTQAELQQYAANPNALANYGGNSSMIPMMQMQQGTLSTDAIQGTGGGQLLIVEEPDSLSGWATRNWPWVAGIGGFVVLMVWIAYRSGYTITNRPSRRRSSYAPRTRVLTPRTVRFKLVPTRR